MESMVLVLAVDRPSEQMPHVVHRGVSQLLCKWRWTACAASANDAATH